MCPQGEHKMKKNDTKAGKQKSSKPCALIENNPFYSKRCTTSIKAKQNLS
jgi:hypothetical protein